VANVMPGQLLALSIDVRCILHTLSNGGFDSARSLIDAAGKNSIQREFSLNYCLKLTGKVQFLVNLLKPNATCLPRSCATVFCLRRLGYNARLRLGYAYAPSENGPVLHSWSTCCNEVLESFGGNIDPLKGFTRVLSVPDQGAS
jgi:hypothetical protein